MSLGNEYKEQAQVYRSIQIRDPDDDELAAAKFIIVALEQLDKNSKERVLKYVADRIDENIWKKLN